MRGLRHPCTWGYLPTVTMAVGGFAGTVTVAAVACLLLITVLGTLQGPRQARCRPCYHRLTLGLGLTTSRTLLQGLCPSVSRARIWRPGPGLRGL